MGIRVIVKNEDAVRRKLAELRRRVSDFRPVWRSVRAYLYRMEQEQFASQGGRGGAPWKPLSPAYARWKAVKHPGKPILELSGKLKRAATGSGPEATYNAQALSLSVGIRNKLAAIHHYGAPRARIPARPIYDHTLNDTEQIAETLVRYILNGV